MSAAAVSLKFLIFFCVLVTKRLLSDCLVMIAKKSVFMKCVNETGIVDQGMREEIKKSVDKRSAKFNDESMILLLCHLMMKREVNERKAVGYVK